MKLSYTTIRTRLGVNSEKLIHNSNKCSVLFGSDDQYIQIYRFGSKSVIGPSLTPNLSNTDTDEVY